MQSRAESRTSMASVTTIDEINMGFELAILAGQEAMLEESSEEGIKLVPPPPADSFAPRAGVKPGHALTVCV